MPRFKFEQWSPYYGAVLDLILEGNCTPELCDPNANCTTQFAAYLATNNGPTATDRCYNVYDCLSAGLLPNEASNFQSAEVLLGLAPSLLATLAPSVREISLLSTRRRFLALLLAVANPSIYVSRLLSFNDPRENLKSNDTAFSNWMLRLDGRSGLLVAATQYLLAAGAIVNVIHLSWGLGFRTVIAWKCNASYMPFLWTIMPLIVHIIAAVGWHISTPVRLINHKGNARAQQIWSCARPWSKLQEMCIQEIQLPSQHGRLGIPMPSPMDHQLTSAGNDKLAIFLNELAGFGAFLHLLFGTTVFSSLMFIGVLDALQVIARYIASGLVCRLIVNWELAAMRAVEKPVEEDTGTALVPMTAKDDGLNQRQTFRLP